MSASSSQPETRTVRAGDATFTLCEYGDPNGVPVFQLHGSPGCRYQRSHDDSVYARVGVRNIIFDRPGYGGTRRRIGRTIRDGARDVLLVADALGIDRFAVLGASGGSPYGIATAALAPERVRAAAFVVPFAPPDGGMESWLAGMPGGTLRELRAAMVGEAALRDVLADVFAGWLPELAAGRLPAAIPAPARPIAGKWLPEAFAQEYDGYVDDNLALVAPWGVDVRAMRVSTSVVVASEDDEIAPAHGRWLAEQIPGATLQTIEGRHTSFLARIEEILADLCARARKD